MFHGRHVLYFYVSNGFLIAILEPRRLLTTSITIRHVVSIAVTDGPQEAIPASKWQHCLIRTK